MSLILRPQFYLDLEEEVAWLAEQVSDEIAQRWYEAVFSTIDFIKSNPDIGRARRDLKQPGIRSWRVEHFTRWLIFYGVRPPDIVFYRVRSGLMNLLVLRMEA